MVIQEQLSIQTDGRSTTEITEQVNDLISNSGAKQGLCNVFIHHTSASLIICENADPSVRSDLEMFLSKTIVDNDSDYQHTTEGMDDMPAHIRTILTDCSITIPVANNRCLLGTWQGIYLYEHRYRGHNRRLTVTIYSE